MAIKDKKPTRSNYPVLRVPIKVLQPLKSYFVCCPAVVTDCNSPVLGEIFLLSTYGVMFMGTPHQGGNGVALGKLMVNVASVFVAGDDRLLRHLERDSESLQQQLGQYAPISGDFVTKFAFEEYATPTVLGRLMVVS
jgi:hypothetical protein